MATHHERALGVAADVARLKALGRTDEAEQGLRNLDELCGYRTADGWYRAHHPDRRTDNGSDLPHPTGRRDHSGAHRR